MYNIDRYTKRSIYTETKAGNGLEEREHQKNKAIHIYTCTLQKYSMAILC